MRGSLIAAAGSLALSLTLIGCGGGGGNGAGAGPGGGGNTLVSYTGATGNFAAWADGASGQYAYAPIGTYAGKKQILHGTVDFMSGQNLGQAAGIEIYKSQDGHVYALDLTSTQHPAAAQLSSESAATIDDTCSLSGSSVAGANYDYLGVSFTADLQTPTNSSYFYRLPGPDGVCNTTDDIVHLVRTGMSAADAPVTVGAMPLSTVHTAQGGIFGFVIKSGANLVLVDGNFANPIVLGTFAAPIGVAQAVPNGLTQGYPSGQLYVIDGNIVYVDYVAHSISAPLLTLPNWAPSAAGALLAASPSTLYVGINSAASGATAASLSIYAIPADGSGAAVVVDNEPGRLINLLYPVQGSDLIWGVVDSTYAIRTFAAGTANVLTLVSSSANAGTFIATASTVYYETWTTSSNASAKVLTRSGTQSGIVGLNGAIIQSPLANSTFVSGGEQVPWPADTTTTQTVYETVLQVQNLTPVSALDTATGWQYVVDGVSGGTLVSIDATSNQPAATLGTIPASGAAFLTGTFRGADHTGFLEATTYLSSTDPASRDLYLLTSNNQHSLTRVTGDL